MSDFRLQILDWIADLQFTEFQSAIRNPQSKISV